jgi:hypothetical protein
MFDPGQCDDDCALILTFAVLGLSILARVLSASAKQK